MASNSKLFPVPGPALQGVRFTGVNELMFRVPTNPLSEVQFVPEKIVEFCTSPDGIRFYKVQWEKTWISEHYLMQHQNLIDTFWQSQNTQSNCESNDQLSNNFSEMAALQTPKSQNITSSYDETSVTTPSVTKGSTPKRKIYSSDLNRPNNETHGIKKTVKRGRSSLSHRTVPPQRRENIIPNVIANLANKNTTGRNSCSIAAKDCGETSTDNTSMIGDGNNLITVTVTEVTESPSQNKKRSIQLDSVELLNVENSSTTDEGMKQYAEEILSSYSKRRPRSPTGKGASLPQTCFFCQKVLSDRKSLREHHLRIHFRNACPFACEICQKRFMMRGMLKEHMLSHSDKRNYACKVCGLTYKWRTQLHRHMKKHQNQKHFQCCLCDKNFMVDTELQEHSLNGEHLNQTNKCTICHEILISPISVYEHSLMHARQVYVCEICNASFKTKSHLTLHENKKHTKSKRDYKCTHCDKEFYKVEDFRKHLEQEHQENSESFKFDYVCTVCGKDFAKEGPLINHMKKHTDGSLYVCTACGREFAYERALQNHMEKHKDGTFRKKRGSVARMSDESLSKLGGEVEKIVSTDTGKAKLQCKLCSREFTFVPSMERHLQKHKSGSLPRKRHLPSQKVAHQGPSKANSYQCKCKRSFKYKSYLLSHLQKCTLANKGASKRKATPSKIKVKLQWQTKSVSPDDICVVYPQDLSRVKRDVPQQRAVTLNAKEKLRVQAEDLLSDDEFCTIVLEEAQAEVGKAINSETLNEERRSCSPNHIIKVEQNNSF